MPEFANKSLDQLKIIAKRAILSLSEEELSEVIRILKAEKNTAGKEDKRNE